MNMKHGTYKGPTHGELKPGETALLLTDMLGEPEGSVKAQFDRKLIVGQVDLSHGWHQFPASDFDLDEEAAPTCSCGSAHSQDGGPMHAAFLGGRAPERKSIPQPRKHPDGCRCMICGGVA